VEDVAAAVKFARTNGIKVSIKGGGHNYQGAAVRDGGILLDLSRLKALQVNASARTAAVGPAVRGGELIAALEPHGLAFPVGHCSDVSLSGFLLNGGLGWNMGAWGASCTNVLAIEVIDANGRILRADSAKNADLFWAARGAGPGFFGVVTNYELALKPMPAAIVAYVAAFDFTSFDVLAEWLPEALLGVHPEVEVICNLDRDANGEPQVSVLAFALDETVEAARARIAALSAHPPGAVLKGPVVDEPVAFQDLFVGVDAGFPSKRMSGDAMLTNASARDVLRAIKPFASALPPAPSAMTFVTLGGSDGFAPTAGAAFSARGSRYFGTYAFWDDSATDEQYRAWVRQVMNATEPLAAGGYIGETDLAAGPDRAARCFSPEAWERLTALKRELDPDDVFFSYLTSA
jgi:FAD/FMN-containing dehydrogenase